MLKKDAWPWKASEQHDDDGLRGLPSIKNILPHPSYTTRCQDKIQPRDGHTFCLNFHAIPQAAKKRKNAEKKTEKKTKRSMWSWS